MPKLMCYYHELQFGELQDESQPRHSVNPTVVHRRQPTLKFHMFQVCECNELTYNKHTFSLRGVLLCFLQTVRHMQYKPHTLLKQ